MSMIQSDLLLGQEGGGGYVIPRSLRFNSSDSAYLSRTPASAGNRTTWSFSAWVKRSKLGSQQFIFTTGEGWNAGSGDSYLTGAAFGADNKLYVYWRSSFAPLAGSAGVYRDPSAWYHVALRTDGSTLKAYVNGTEVCSGAISGNGGINSTQAHSIGVSTSSTFFGYADFFLADIHFIDGQALTPSSFGEFDTNNVWQPKAFSGGSYGTNGFHLDFADNSAATAAALGKDVSGLGNNWTPNNLSVTAGAGNDSTVDSPTNYGTDTGAGGEVRGNYATLNPLFSSATLTNGNLDAEGPTNAWHIARGTIAFPTSDKWYWEATVTGTAAASYAISVATAAAANSVADVTTATGLYGIVNNTGTTTTKFINGTASTISTAAAWAQNDILMCAYEGATGKVWFGRNGTWYPPTSGGSAGNPGAGTNETMTASGTVFPAVHCYGTSADMAVNFGQRPFAYTAPNGFKALCTANLPTPTIANGATAMDVVLWTGDNSNSRTLSGLNFSPDLVWKKRRTTNGDSHYLVDSVRGDNSGVMRTLFSNQTVAEQTTSSDQELQYGYISGLTSTGFTVAAGSNGSIPRAAVNDSSYAYVAWCFDAGASTVTNTQGSITSQVRANASSGFSICTFTQPSSSGSFSWGHGLNAAPQLVIMKPTSSTGNWQVYHASTGAQYLWLNSTNAATGTGWSTINSSIVTATATLWAGNFATVAYCFAPVAGYSSALSWTGNGSNDGPLLHCGFVPRFFIAKRTDAGNDWWMWDTARSSTGNPVDEWLSPNRSDGEYANDADFDFLSNGIKIRTNSTTVNASGGTYIGFAWASNPFQYARAQ